MPSLSRYRIHKNLVPSRRNTTPSFSIGLAIRHLLFEGRAECFEFRFEEPDVSTHYAEMGNLLSLDPKIHSLGAHAKEFGGLTNGQRIFFERKGERVLTLYEGILIHWVSQSHGSIHLLAEHPNGSFLALWNFLRVQFEPW